MASRMDFSSYYSDDNSNQDEINYDDNDDFSPSSGGQDLNPKIKRSGKRGRKPAKVDVKAKLERSRQSARECRARKKLRYQYLEELVASRERAIHILRKELDQLKDWCIKIDTLDKEEIPQEVYDFVAKEKQRRLMRETKSNSSESSFHSILEEDEQTQMQNFFFMKLNPNETKSFRSHSLTGHISSPTNSLSVSNNFDSNNDSSLIVTNSNDTNNSPIHMPKQDARRFTLSGQNRLLAQLIEQDLEPQTQSSCDNSFSSHLLTELNATVMKH